MIYLIAGRTGSGKDYLANLLAAQGLKLVKSYATRPKRNEDEDSHIFISPEESDNYPDKVAYTKIGDYEYFATAQQVSECDAYIIDPVGIDVLTKNMPDETFHIVYVSADDMDRKINAIKRAEDKIKEEEIFDNRDMAEDQQFTEFENKLKTIAEGGNTPFEANVTRIYKYENEYNEQASANYAKYLLRLKTQHDKFAAIVTECANMDIIHIQDGKCAVVNNDGSTHYETIEHFTDVVLGDDTGVASLMKAFVMNSDKFATEAELKSRLKYVVTRTSDRDTVKLGQADCLEDAQAIMKSDFIKWFYEKYGQSDEISFEEAYEPLAGKEHEITEYEAWLNECNHSNFDWNIFSIE